MNLMALLVPFLLMAARFLQVSAIETPLREVVPPGPGDRAPPDVTIVVDRAGLEIRPEVAGLAPLDLPCPDGACEGSSTYDVAGLTRALGQVKDARPLDRRIVILPAPEVSYAAIVRIMDACREDPTAPDATGRPRVLFPDPVLAGVAGDEVAP